jgi:hypothetical protein
VTVEPVRAPARSAVVVAVSAARWAREMARNRARELVEAEFGPPPEPDRPEDWAIRVWCRGDPPTDWVSRLKRGSDPPE